MTIKRISAAILLLACTAKIRADTPKAPAHDPTDLIQKIQGELSGPLTEDSKPHSGVPQGEIIEGTISDPKIYPGTENNFRVYVPAQYNPAQAACLLLRLDGIGKNETTVLDNLIASGDMPVTIAVGLSSGTVWEAKGTAAYRWNRSYEFDSTNGDFARFVIDVLLPRVESLGTRDGRPIRLSHAAADRAVTGASTGGIGSFTLAWERPDSFSRVYSVIGTFVSMRGGNDYPAIIRKAEPKPIRVFLEDGSDDAWNPLFGSWFMANENMEAALSFAGYDVQHAWGTHGHDGGPGNVILPDVMRWLWRGWPAPVAAGVSKNDMLTSIVGPREGWQRVGGNYGSAGCLASDPSGNLYFCDSNKHILWRIGADGEARVFSRDVPAAAGIACGPDGTPYATLAGEARIVAFDSNGGSRTAATGIQGSSIVVTSGNVIYVAEPGAHSDEASNVWRILPSGEKTLLNRGLLSVSGIALSPDHALFFAAEGAGSRIYSFVTEAAGNLQDKEPFYWLHPSDGDPAAGTREIAVDAKGDLYAATPQGIQVCDRNGRVRAILWLPTPCGAVEGIGWGGSGFRMLYASDGTSLFRRILGVSGFPQWSAPIALPKSNAG
jgi:enterochelin esterase-like enzyme/sugar lactone lactonase YvrE